MIKNIIFDLSEVIISGYHGVEKNIEKETGILFEDFLYRKKETIDYFLDAMRGKHTENDYFKYLLKDTNWNLSINQIKEIFRKYLNIPIEGTMNIVKELKRKYNLILLSDYLLEWKDFIMNNNDDLKIFDYQYFSFEIGKLKSDDGTFQHIIDDLNIKPNETLFIDDYSSNVESARKNGINGIVFKDAKQLRNELVKLELL